MAEQHRQAELGAHFARQDLAAQVIVALDKSLGMGSHAERWVMRLIMSFFLWAKARSTLRVWA